MSRIIKSSFVKLDETVYNVDVPPEDSFSDESGDESDGAVQYGDSVFKEFDQFDELSGEYEEISELSLSAEEIIEKAGIEAEEIIESAKNEAIKIIEDARVEAATQADDIKNDASEKGYAEGKKKGDKEASVIIKNANDTLEAAKAEKEQILKSAEPQIVRLVTDIVDKLIGDCVKISDEIILFLIRKGLSQSTSPGKLSIHVSTAQYDKVIESRQLIESFVDSHRELEFVKDVLLEENECIIESQFGNIDSSIDTQLESLKRDLLLMLGEI